jgi:hypothetical protein
MFVSVIFPVFSLPVQNQSIHHYLPGKDLYNAFLEPPRKFQDSVGLVPDARSSGQFPI